MLALAEFKKSGFALTAVGPGIRLKVDVEAPTTTHELSIGKLQAWLDFSGKTPREQAVKVTLRQVLGHGQRVPASHTEVLSRVSRYACPRS